MPEAARVVLDEAGLAAFKADVHKFARKVAAEIADDVRANVPVDTGELRNSIAVVPVGDGFHVEAPTDHTLFVEFGTSTHPANPVMRTAAYKPRAL